MCTICRKGDPRQDSVKSLADRISPVYSIVKRVSRLVGKWFYAMELSYSAFPVTGRALMAPYLPRDGPSGSQYSEGGALYALGLITANHGHDMREFLLTSLRNASGGAGGSKPIIQHGACLGLGKHPARGEGGGNSRLSFHNCDHAAYVISTRVLMLEEAGA
jgi:hypothetical protein